MDGSRVISGYRLAAKASSPAAARGALMALLFLLVCGCVPRCYTQGTAKQAVDAYTASAAESFASELESEYLKFVSQLHYQIEVALKPFVSQMARPCTPALTNIMNERCAATLPSLVDGILHLLMFAPEEESGVADGVIDEICQQCGRDMFTEVQDVLQQHFDPAADDPSCNNSLPAGLSIQQGGLVLDRVIQFLCAEREPGVRCMHHEVIPTALQESGVYDMIRKPPVAFMNMIAKLGDGNKMTSTDLLSIGTTLLADRYNLFRMCTGLEVGGCCSRSLLQTVKAFLDATCAPGASSDALPLFPDFCGMVGVQIPPRCKDYTPYKGLKKQPRCPSLRDIQETVINLTPVEETEYHNCTLGDGICPRNSCELLMCRRGT